MKSHVPGVIDVCLLNGRSYVQGTQIISRVCESRVSSGAKLAQAKFLRLTNRSLCAVYSNDSASNELAIGAIEFKSDAGREFIQLLELPELAPERSQPPRILIVDLQHDHDLTGRYSFDAAPTVEGVLDGLVQGIKLLHEELAMPARNIWFTGFRNFSLPLELPNFTGRGQVDVTKLRVLSNQGTQQSMMKVTLSLQGWPELLGGLVSFAFTSGVGIVD
jgi:hypothetical protein